MLATTTTPLTTHSLAPTERATGPLLVACDGRKEDAAALTVARLLSDRAGVPAEVVSVLEPTNIVAPPLAVAPPPSHPGATRIEERRARLAAASTAALGKAVELPTRIVLGGVAHSIGKLARERDARLVITGLVHHGRIERSMRRETPLAIVQRVGVPVLAVPPTTTGLPRTVVVAVGEAEERSGARLGSVALPLLADARAIHLVHVKPREPLFRVGSAEDDDDTRYDAAIASAFNGVRSSWPAEAGFSVKSHVLTGRSAEELLDFAESVQAELLVVGFSPRSLLHQARVGGVATRLFRGAACSVLLVPDARREGLRWGDGTTVSAQPEEWPAMLREFVQRNAGRTATLEVDDDGQGAQVLVHEFQLTGVDLDPHSETLSIAMGDVVSGLSHLTHRIVRPTAIGLHRRSGGSDGALAVEYDGGQALLTLRPSAVTSR